jgi:pyruvate/2-oxoglutarate dehydrogenase complex dihydrolipoamide dehydrogenase (E3) component/uncharacterized membrane protein YdjX (TVP38/TMEM64 family)
VDTADDSKQLQPEGSVSGQAVPEGEQTKAPLGWLRPLLLLGLLVLVLVLARVFGLAEKLGDLRSWIKGLGPLGALVFLVIYIIAAVTALPGSVFTIAGGALYGSVWGVILVSVAATIGASLAFLISRYFARQAVVNWLGPHEKFQRLDRLTEERGAIIVALTRLTPLFPYNLLNYGLGLTRVHFWTYVFWSWLCMLPGIMLYVVGSDAIFRALAQGRVSWLLIITFLVVLFSVVVTVRFVNRRLGISRKSPAAGGSFDSNETLAFPELSPPDEHNRELLANVHPADWENPEPALDYNLVVIGAGTAGLVSAAGAAGLGAKVALVERNLMGGDCLNYGCVPSKAIIRSSRVFADLCRAGSWGLEVPEEAAVDFSAVMARMRRLRADLSRHDSARRFRELGVDVFLGQGRFSGPHTVEVDGKTLHFAKAVIATGARAVHPSIRGLAGAGYLTNETVFSLTERPSRLLVMGGGPLGCEFAQAFQRLGCQVILLHKHPRLMNREDPDAAAIVQKAFAREGISLILNARATRVTPTDLGKAVYFEQNGREQVIEVDEILVGAGRAPNVEGLNLEAAKVSYEGGTGRGVLVNDRLQTTNPDIYAAGDICLPHRFTHLADAAARLVIQNALFFGRRKVSELVIPWCTYTDPEVAQVGLSEQEARKQGVAYQVFIKPLREVDRAVLDGEEEGFVKILVKKGSDKILGATIVARHAGEMISEVTCAMVGKMGLGTLASVIHPYPTQAEAIRAVGDLYNRTRLTSFRKKLLNQFLAWRR